MPDVLTSSSLETRSIAKVPAQAKGHRYWPGLDGVRGLAVLTVMLVHASSGRLPGGFLGVDLFFCLSGFLITVLLISEWRQTGNVRLGSFYMRRILRLYPALVVTVVMAYFWWPKEFMGAYIPAAAGALFYHENFRFAQTGVLAHTWSLSLEEQFYILYPPILLLLLKRKARLSRWLLAAAGAAIVLRCALLLAHVDTVLLRRSVLGRADTLVAGALLALWFTRWETKRRLQAEVSSTRAGFLLAPGNPERIGWACLALWIALQFFVQDDWKLLTAVGQCAVTLLCTGFVFVAITGVEATLFSRLLRSAPLRYLGTRSYGLYLYHFVIFPWLDVLRRPHSLFNTVWLTALRFAASFAAAEVSYRLIEMPFLRLKRHFEPHQKRTPDSPPVEHDRPKPLRSSAA